MSKVLTLLQETDGAYISGESMSRKLGITRAAVWKQVRRLREAGYEIEAVTNLGYRLKSSPERLSAVRIREALGVHPWQDRITVVESVDSTNSMAKREALAGARHGSVYLADEQTGGRGRLGRSFLSARGKGLYLSVLLRPDCAPTQIGHVTAMAAVAACNAVETCCGIRPGIKWTNDLILGEKKMTGILSEMSVEWESGTLEYVVVGIGINCSQRGEDFPEELRNRATSIEMETGRKVDRCSLAAELIRELERLSKELIAGKAVWIARYAEDCITLGREVRIIRGDQIRTGVATAIDENGALVVRYDSGETGVVFTGEVSVRGTDGYL